MDARVMQDIDDYPSSCVNGAEPFFDNNSRDFTQQFASINFWDNLEESSGSSFVNSVAASVALHTPSTSANSPTSNPPAELPNNSNYQSHKHGILRNSVPKKRRCSGESKSSRFYQDPSALDCSDYWLRFDSEDESPGRLFEYQNQVNRPLNAAETSADAQVRSPSLTRRLIRTSTIGTANDATKVAYPPLTSETIDDSALDQALSDDDEVYSMPLAHELGTAATGTPAPPPEVEERLYSTPLSWEPPRPGYHMNYVDTNMPLTDVERQRLLSIALGTGSMVPQRVVGPPIPAEFYFEGAQKRSETPGNVPERKHRSQTTKPSGPPSKDSSDTAEKPREKPKSSERAAHNDIERKYRTNLKDKIAELRDAVPSLRSMSGEDDPGVLAGSSRTAPKVSKGTVLTKATEYIHQLERRNRSAAQKNEELAQRLRAFEQLFGTVPSSNWRLQGYGGPVYNQRF
ncbi:helix-loop-helix DNA-binding domain-containing protein [Poronia punctata]|nr:helix-loop-helix DNA-binding domain-containing protein [Poronia punctata]